LRHLTIENFNGVWNAFEDNKEWFPHVRNQHIKNRLDWGQVILHDGVIITYQKNKKNRRIGRDSDVTITQGSHMIHQIINTTKGKGNAVSAINEFFKYVQKAIACHTHKNNINIFYSFFQVI